MHCWTQNARFSKGSGWKRENTDAEWAVPALQIGKVDSRSDPQRSLGRCTHPQQLYSFVEINGSRE